MAFRYISRILLVSSLINSVQIHIKISFFTFLPRIHLIYFLKYSYSNIINNRAFLSSILDQSFQFSLTLHSQHTISIFKLFIVILTVFQIYRHLLSFLTFICLSCHPFQFFVVITPIKSSSCSCHCLIHDIELPTFLCNSPLTHHITQYQSVSVHSCVFMCIMHTLQ